MLMKTSAEPMARDQHGRQRRADDRPGAAQDADAAHDRSGDDAELEAWAAPSTG